MINQSRKVEEILNERLATIQKISDVTAEHLRLVQKRAGIQVLEMSDREMPEVPGQMGRNEGALEICEQKIEDLERQLRRLDEELEAKVEGGKT